MFGTWRNGWFSQNDLASCEPATVEPSTTSKNMLRTVFLASTLVIAAQAKHRVACVGDSITFGYLSSGPASTYPSQLQEILGDGFEVVNLGENGVTMQRSGDSPWWDLEQFATLNNSTWDTASVFYAE